MVVCSAIVVALTASSSRANPTRLGAAFKQAKPLLPIFWTQASQRQAVEPTPGKSPPTAHCAVDEDCAAGSYCDSGRCVTADHPLNIAYLYYRSGDRKFSEVLGIYWHQRGDPGYRVVFPLYWHFWDRTEKTRIVAPLFFSFRGANSRSLIIPPYRFARRPGARHHQIWPLFFYSNYGDQGGGLAVWPLFHYSRKGQRRLTIAPALLTFVSSDGEKKKSAGLIGGLYYFNRNQRRKIDLLVPLFSHSRSRRARFTWVAPLNFFWRDRQNSGAMVFPFYLRTSSATQATALSLVPPLVYRRHASGYNWFAPLLYGSRDKDRTAFALFPLLLHRHSNSYRQWLSPLFAYERDSRAGIRQWGLLAPPFYHRRDAEREVDTLFPLFWRIHNKVERTTTWAIPPFVYYRDPVGATTALFPIYWRFSDSASGNATSIAFPLFYHHRKGDGRGTTMLFPFYYRKKADGFTLGALPLFYYGRSAHKSHAVLFPAIWYVRNERQTTGVVGPLFWRRYAAGGYNAGLAPLLFAGERQGDSHQVLFPLYWHLRSQRAGYNSHVLGPAFYTNGRKGTLGGLLPLFLHGHWQGRRITLALPALFYRSRDVKTGHGHTLIGPYYAFDEAKQSGVTLFPLYFRRVFAKPAGTETHTTLLPLFYHRRSGQAQLLVTPLGGFVRSAKKRTTVIGPVAWTRSDELRGVVVAPFFIQYARPKRQEKTTILMPLGVRHRSPELNADLLFPFFWRFSDPKERSLVLFPIYWSSHARDGKTGFSVVFPLAWNFYAPKRRLRIYGPFFDRTNRARRTTGLAPLFIYQRNSRRSYMAALPLTYYYHDFATAKRTWVVAAGYFRRYKKGYGAGLFPFYFHRRTPQLDYSVLAPVFWYWRNKEADTTTTALGPLFYRRNRQHRGFALLPLFYYGYEGQTRRTAAALPLFYYHGDPTTRTLYTPLFGSSKSLTRRLWYVLPVFSRRSDTSTFSGAFPLFLYNRNHRTQTTTFFATPLYYATWSKRRSFHLVFPLFWHLRQVDSSATVAFPLYWDFNDRHRDRTTMVFPLFLRQRDHVKDSTSYFFPPGIWFRSRRTAKDLVVFPLLWHFGGDKRSSSVLFPLYWDFKRPGRRSTVLFPIYWRFENHRRTAMVFLNSYYRRNKAEKTFAYHFIPLFNIERRRPGDIRWEFIPGGLVGYERIGRNRFLKLFFFFNWRLQSAGSQHALEGPKQASANWFF